MSDNVIVVTAENWESEVMESDLPVIVDLWAPWCGPCRTLAPILDELAGTYAGRVKVAKVNVDEQPEISQAFEIQSIPTMGVVYQGGLVGKVVGFGGRPHVEQIFQQVAEIPQKVKEMDPEESGAAPDEGADQG